MNREQRRAAAHRNKRTFRVKSELENAQEALEAQEIYDAAGEVLRSGSFTGTAQNGWEILEFSAQRVVARKGRRTISMELDAMPTTADEPHAIDGFLIAAKGTG